MKVNRSNMQTPATTTVERPVPGVYPIVITDVQDCPNESHLKVWYDIAEGPYKGHYSRMRAEHPDMKEWYGMYRRYYTTAAMWAFDKLCEAVSRSNGNYVFDGDKANADEKTLIGKKMGLVLRGREYYGNDGNLRIRLEVFREVPLDQVPYQRVPEVLTIAKQEEIKARREARKQGATPAPAPAAYAQPTQAFAQQAQSAPVQQPTYQQATKPVQAPAYRAQQQPAQQAYANPALAQFVDVSGNAEEMMPFM